MALKFTQITAFSPPLLQQIEAIYVASFPPAERVPIPVIVNSVMDGALLLYALEEEEDSQIVGFAMLAALNNTGFYILDYLAVAEIARNRGLGARLLDEVADALRARGAAGIILESESEREGAPSEVPLRQRRIAFYLRNGYAPLTGLPFYRVPDLSGGPVLSEMRLLWRPLQHKTIEPAGALLRACVLTIYANEYGLSADAPLVQATLAALES